LEEQVAVAQSSLQEAEAKIEERNELENLRNEAREKNAALKVENESLRKEMDEIKKRIDSLEQAQGNAACPVCGQELSETHRKSTLKELNKEGKDKGNLFRTNKTEIEEIEKRVTSYELRVIQLASAENERIKYSSVISQLTERIDSFKSAEKEWEKSGKKRLAEVSKALEKESFAAEARKQLAKLDKELVKLGYDAAAHESARLTEANGRSTEEEHSNLKSAREVSKQIESEIKNLEEEKSKKEEEVREGEKTHQAAAQNLAESETNAPNILEAEDKLRNLREDENEAHSQIGAARQKVEVLATQRARKTDYAAQREELNQHIVRHKTLERAFGKDGVPALLIEQALPQIEQKANDLLDRLSDGHMSIRFVTQSEYKDKKRDDLKETLDIQISDSAGLRNYEMYSGGEAFRVNFAIRLALSEILAQRKGARLQTLVIDEGFGSQDAQGRQRLIEAINLVKHDFAKILIITHLDELKDAFPNRIEVEKTERGSSVTVI
jgi:exonuclease SbcC